MTSSFVSPVLSTSGLPPFEGQLHARDGRHRLSDALTALEQLNTSNLQIRWKEVFGRKAHARLGGEILKRAIAFRLQELELGGLSRQAELRLKTLGNRVGNAKGSRKHTSLPIQVKSGTRFIREWQNEMHEVQATDNGDFFYRGKSYRSLSLIAREITGTHQSGPRFFGIRKIDPTAAKREAPDG